MSQAMSRALDRFRKIYTLSVFLFYFSALGCEGADWHATTFFDAVEQDWNSRRVERKNKPMLALGRMHSIMVYDISPRLPISCTCYYSSMQRQNDYWRPR